MGYYYTSSLRPIPTAISCASPKTHTPDSRVKERGHRFYSPGLGRWSSRDPLGEHIGGMNTYTFVGNRPASSIDLLGLCCKCLSFDPVKKSGLYRYLNGRLGNGNVIDPDYPADAWIVEEQINVKVNLQGNNPSQCKCAYKENGFQELIRLFPAKSWYSGVLGAGDWPNGCAGGFQDFPKVGIEDFMQVPGGTLWLILFNFNQSHTCTSDDGSSITYSYSINDSWVFSL